MNIAIDNTIEPNAFSSPFDAIVEDAINSARVLHTELRTHLREQYKDRPLLIRIADVRELNAYTQKHDGHDEICIYRGVFEQIITTMYGLLSAPGFLSDIGASNNEIRPTVSRRGFCPVDLLSKRDLYDSDSPVFAPRDRNRGTIALLLSELAIEFLIFHELGHILGGHHELLESSSIGEMQQWVAGGNIIRQLLEIDADAFALDVTSHSYLKPRTQEIIAQAADISDSRAKNIGFRLYLTGIGVLFRMMYPNARYAPFARESSHPHPATRSCLIGSCVLVKALLDYSHTQDMVEALSAQSIGNVETVWADLFSQVPSNTDLTQWGSQIWAETTQLFHKLGSIRDDLAKHARLPRRWDRWDWAK